MDCFLQPRYVIIQGMKNPDDLLAEEADDLVRRGLEPEMVENLLASLESWQKIRPNITLEEIFYLEVDDTSVLDDPEMDEEEEPKKDLGQVYRQAASGLTLQDLGEEE